MTDEYETANCCKLDCEKTLRCDLSQFVGYSVTKDILVYSKCWFEKTGLNINVSNMRKKWKKAFIQEIRLLLDLYQP